MDISGWEVDVSAIYGRLWKKRVQFHLSERLCQSPVLDSAVLLFGIGEVSMNKQVGRLALLRGKQAPRLIYHSGRRMFWFEGLPWEPVVFSEDGRHARVYELVKSTWWRRELGCRERVLDCESGGLSDAPAGR
jgi:hypothetical protein